MYNGLTLFGEARLGEEMVVLPPGCRIYPSYSLPVQEIEDTVIIDAQAMITLYPEQQRLKETEGMM